MFSHRTSLSLSGFLPEMSDTTPPTKKMAHLSLADQGQKKRRRQRKHHTQKDYEISWKDIHDLVTAAQAMCPPQAPLSSILLAVFVILHANSATAQPLLSLPNTYHWRFYTRETLFARERAWCSYYVIDATYLPTEGLWDAVAT